MPAVLKGFIDKVFTAHFAFKFVTMPVISKIMGGIPRPLLKGKKAVVFLTTGSNWIAWWFFLRRRARKLMLTDILGFFGIKARVYHLGSCRIVDEGRILKIKKMVAKGLAGF
jgi:putative NADPH-quinone reductase